MVLLIRGNVVQSLTQYNAVPDGNVASPGLSFAHAPTTGLSRSTEGNLVVSVGGNVAMEVSTEGITANAFVGDGAGLSNIAAANVTGLTAALDVIDASSVSSNVFVGDGSGLSNIAAANVTGLTAALDVIDASSVSSNVVYGDASGDLQIGANLVPTSNVAFNLGTELLRFKDLFLSGNTIDLGGSLIQSVLGNVVIGNLDVTNIRGNGRGLSGIVIPPSITSVTITDSSWNPIDDLALSTTSTGYFLVGGNNFEPVGTTVSVGGTAAASITFVNSQLLRVSVNPKSTGTYDIYIETSGGSTIKINAVSFDPFPVWSTGSSLGNVYYGNTFSIPLSASDGGSSITYSNTSALPPSTTLASNGRLTGNIVQTSSSTYNFSVEAIDAQLQSALRSFSLVYTYFVASGGTVKTSEGYQYHTFTANGTFTVAGTSTIDILVVGGGGGGGKNRACGGGGGHVLLYTGISLSEITANVTIGIGGEGGNNNHWPGYAGGNSMFAIAGGATYTAPGGGLGQSDGVSFGPSVGGSSGKNLDGTVTTYTGGSYSNYTGGGGAGANANGSNQGVGGGGLQVWGTYYGGGGGGGLDGYGTSVPAKAGGLGGGGTGAPWNSATPGNSGTNGLGGGGGGGSGKDGILGGYGGNGGSGVVIVRYLV